MQDEYTVAGRFMSSGLRKVDTKRSGGQFGVLMDFESHQDPGQAMQVVLVAEDARRMLDGLRSLVAHLEEALAGRSPAGPVQ